MRNGACSKLSGSAVNSNANIEGSSKCFLFNSIESKQLKNAKTVQRNMETKGGTEGKTLCS